MSALRRPRADEWQRVCFRLQVDPARLDEYRRRHAAVWPDMLRALHETGWHNYSLFLDEDGTLIGYFETPSLTDAIAGMAGRDVNARWQAEMGEFFLEIDTAPDEGFVRLAEVFQLETQLERIDAAAPTQPDNSTHDTPSNPPAAKEPLT